MPSSGFHGTKHTQGYRYMYAVTHNYIYKINLKINMPQHQD